MSVERQKLDVGSSAPRGAVFLSYASQDAEAARRICDSLRSAGVEVWFDQSELVGGDQWDGKIRGQIGSCALFVPIISANTQARLEGYFRLEWKLAAQRTHTMADEKAFLLPVLIDGTRDAEAKVPAEFKSVQWTKLPSGDTPPAFAQRVMKLLSGSEMEAGRPRPAERGEGTASPKKTGKRWLVPVVLGAVAIAVATVWLTRKPAPASTTDSKTATAQPGAASLTEAQKLVAQARKIYDDGDELNRDNLFLADEMVQRALALDPSEPSAWELATWFSYIMVWHAIDVTQARRETLLRQANRAIALAPDSIAAQLVYANAQLAGRFGGANASPGNFAPIEASLKQLAGREPQNWKIQRALGTVYRLTERMDEAVRAFNRAIELSDGDPMATADLVNVLIRRNRFAEAEALLARGLAHHRSSRLLTFNLIVKYRWRGDVESAAGDIADWPEWLLQQDRGFAVAWQAALWARQPDLALRLVLQFSRQEVRDIIFSGPKAVLSARAQELAGNIIAAQADWRAVLQQCDQELAANASDLTALYWKAWALARLGDQTGAQAAATLLRQRLQSVPSNYIHSYTAAALWATVGWTDVAVTTLQAELQTPTDYISLSRAGLELEPAFDPIRQDPRFRELVRLAPAPAPAPSSLSPSTSSVADSKSVAVLAFANLSDDKDNEYFSDGISEELLNVLAKIPGLKVTARTSSFHFKGKDTPIPEIAQKLGVAYVVEGSVRKSGDKVRITAQLIKAADGFHVWSDTFTRDLKDIFAVQDEIAGLIAKNLSLRLGVDRSASGRATVPEAFELYLEGRAAWNLRTREGYARAGSLLGRAIDLDPGFARAHTALADVWSIAGYENETGGGTFGWRNSPTVAKIAAKAGQALALDPQCAEAYTSQALALEFRWEWAAAERAYRRAIELNPNYSTARHWFGMLLWVKGDMDEALRQLQLAAESDPLSHRILDTHARMLNLMGRPAEALAVADRALALQPLAVQAATQKAHALVLLGRAAEAVALIEKALAWGGSIEQRTNALVVLHLAGADAAMRRVIGSTAEMPASQFKFASLIALGRPDEALAGLRPADLHENQLISMALFQFYDPVRDDPRFLQAIRDVGYLEDYRRARAWLAANLPKGKK